MLTLETRQQHGGPTLRRWEEEPAALTPDWLDKLADQSMWDYEAFGATETFVVLPCGDLPLAALMVGREVAARIRPPNDADLDGEELADALGYDLHPEDDTHPNEGEPPW